MTGWLSQPCGGEQSWAAARYAWTPPLKPGRTSATGAWSPSPRDGDHDASRVSARPAVISVHQPHGPRQDSWAANVTATARALAASSVRARAEAAVSANASTGHT